MKVTKLKIYKNKRVADRDNLFNYVFEWISGDTVVWKETMKMSADELMQPIESYNLDDIIKHKQECCMVIDPATLIIETIEI